MGSNHRFLGRQTKQRPLSKRLALEPLESRAVLTALAPADDLLDVAQDQSLLITPVMLLANDVAGSHSGLQVALSLQNGPSPGSLRLNSDGTFLYQPALGFSGSDSFQYYVGDADGYSAEPATVSIRVQPPTSSGGSVIIGLPPVSPCSIQVVPISENGAPPPLYLNNDCYETDEDTLLVIAAPGVLANDSSGPSGSLVAEVHEQPAHGSVAIEPNGSFSYQPNRDYFGSDQFVYKGTNGDGSSLLATVFVEIKPVNDAPVVQDDSLAAESGVPLQIASSQLLANDLDVDNGAFSAALPLSKLPRHGTLTLRGSSLHYVSAPAFEGTDSFEYFATDRQLISGQNALVSLSVAAPIRHNRRLASDVNEDDRVTALDALLVINYLNAFGPAPLADAASVSRDLLDVNDDGTISATDALMVINGLNAGLSADITETTLSEPEPSNAESLPHDQHDGLLTDLLATSARRRGRK